MIFSLESPRIILLTLAIGNHNSCGAGVVRGYLGSFTRLLAATHVNHNEDADTQCHKAAYNSNDNFYPKGQSVPVKTSNLEGKLTQVSKLITNFENFWLIGWNFQFCKYVAHQ